MQAMKFMAPGISRNSELHNKETLHTGAISAGGSVWIVSSWDPLIVIKLWLMLCRGASGSLCLQGHKMSLRPRPTWVYHAVVLQTQGSSDKVSQDIPECRGPSSRACTRIPLERWGNSSLWNAGIWLIHWRIRLNLQRLIWTLVQPVHTGGT